MPGPQCASALDIDRMTTLHCQHNEGHADDHQDGDQTWTNIPADHTDPQPTHDPQG